MSFKNYIKDKFVAILAYLFLALIVAALLVIFGCQKELIIITMVLFVIMMVPVLLWDFFRRKSFYNELANNLAGLDKKYLVLEMMNEPSFYEGKLIWQMLYEINKSMTENVKVFEMGSNDFKEYIQMWVHEVKLPISSISLMCHNNKSELMDRLEKQVRRIDNYTEQVLYFVRSENPSDDYHIKKMSLSDIVKKVVLRNKDDILEGAVDLVVENVDKDIVSDGKWLEFMLNQIVSNSMKYGKKDEKLQIKIYGEEISDNSIYNSEDENTKVVLHIRDNGIGIPKQDLKRVFNKSFTGENGRDYAKSTGMGLYIVKGLCRKLGHHIEIASVENEYTDVIITFQNCNVL